MHNNYNPELEILQQPANYVDHVIRQDEHRFDLLEELQSLQPSVTETPRFCRKGFIVLPEALLEQYSAMNIKCFMGLFPEINRAWMSIDNKIFLWSYKNGSDFNEYDELDQVIMSAGLVKPRKGVFKNYVKYLLVLSTMVEIVIVGVSFTNNDEAELNLLPMKYSASSDGIGMVKIEGTEDGRIFMAGQDGCLYELLYEAQDGWFSKRCQKVNCTQSSISALVNPFFKFTPTEPLIDITIDNQRHALYTLSNDSRIDIYSLGEYGRQCSHLGAVSDVIKQAKSISQKVDWDQKRFKLISISIISKFESPILRIVAVSSQGFRFYFAPRGSNSLELKEVRPPFSNTSKRDTLSKSSRQRHLQIHKAFANKGVVIMADSKDEDTDNLLCFNIEGEIAHGLERGIVAPVSELVTTVEVEGRNLEVAEVPMSIVSPEALLLFARQTDQYLDELVSQLLLPPREFVSLSSNGIYLLTKLRPIDQLAQILHQYGGPGAFDTEEALRIMIERYGPHEVCAMCVMLASSDTLSVRTPASVLQSVVQPSITSSPIATSQQVARAAQDLFVKLAGEPTYQPAMPDMRGGALPAEPQLIFSSAHEAFFLFFSRVVRPLWRRPFLRVASKADIYVRLPREVLAMVETLLLSLKEFFDSFPHLHRPSAQPLQGRSLNHLPADGMRRYEDRQLMDIAMQQQQLSLSALYSLTLRNLQALFFLDLLHEYKLPRLMCNFRQDKVRRLSEMTFRDLVLHRECEVFVHDIVRRIVSVDQTGSVDTLCDMLHDKCWTFFTQADLHDYKAYDLLEKAKSIKSDPERREQLMHQALNTYMDIAAHIDIAAICREFWHLGFYTGAIKLALAAADQTDPSGLGTEWYKSEKSPTDTQGKRMFEARTACYNCVLTVFEELYRPVPTIASTPRKSPLAAARDEVSPSRHFTEREWISKRKAALRIAQSSRDVLFHDILYRWFLQNNHKEELIRMKSSFIESFLKRQDIELLWQYYHNNERFDRAAEILLTLAEKPDIKVGLDTRLKYLSEAISNAKASSGMGELLQTLQERMEVAKIQADVCKELKEHMENWTDKREIEGALLELNSELFTISDLYNRYCTPFELHRSALACLCCAQYEDATRIRRLWVKIFDTELQKSFENLQRQLCVLAGRYISKNSVFFPLDYIATIAAQYHLEQGWDARDRCWFPREMLKAKVPFDALYDAYYAIYEDVYGRYAGGGDLNVREEPIRLERNDKSKLFILGNLGFIMAEWATQVSSPAASLTEKQRFPIGKLENHLDMFKSNLGEFPDQDALGEKQIMDRVKTLFGNSPGKRRSHRRTSFLA